MEKQTQKKMERKTHDEFMEVVKLAVSLPTLTKKALSPESEEDFAILGGISKMNMKDIEKAFVDTIYQDLNVQQFVGGCLEDLRVKFANQKEGVKDGE